MSSAPFQNFGAQTFENAMRSFDVYSKNLKNISDHYSSFFSTQSDQLSKQMESFRTSDKLSSDWQNYLADAQQRSALTLDVLRQRGNQFNETVETGAPPVLNFEYDVIVDGRDLPRPVNYQLVVIKPPAHVTVDPTKRAFLIIDPRAGHGAGIGGFKPESQVGEAFEDGHAVYFVIFRPQPEPGQTLADVRDAEKVFLDEIAKRHPDAEAPIVIGNCQGGWASMILAASAPDKVGALSINGSPMSYWAGTNGKNPMRYTGGIVGGITPALMMSDLGKGVFDGSLLVENFENLNPANTHWKKLYNLYANVDTEGERFLDFERWWGSFFMMNEEEIRWIVDNLFIGNRLATGQAKLGDEQIDLKKITSPIIVFASHGDNITPPQQALNWIPDLYRDVNEIKALGQRIVYMVHDSIGHLGIFVSAKIAGREHDAITDTMSAIEALPPGLYEMVLEQGDDRVHIKFAPRVIEDILKLDDGRADEEMFAAVAQLSETGAELYNLTLRPLVRGVVSEQSAKAFFAMRPLRIERMMFSDKNPMMKGVAESAEKARAERVHLAEDNHFRVAEKLISNQIEQSLNFYRDIRDASQEFWFHSVFGSPIMRMIGAKDIESRQLAANTNAKLHPAVQAALASINTGNEAEGMVRMLQLLSEARGYTRRSRLERELELFEQEEPFKSMDGRERAKLIHQQALIVQFAPEEAKASLPKLLNTQDERRRALDFVMRIAGPEDTMNPAALALYREFERDLLAAVPARNGLADSKPSEVSTVMSGRAAATQYISSSHYTTATRPSGSVRLSAPAGQADDLIAIKGIGPVLLKELNDLGVYHFWQIANWSETDAASFGLAIGHPGRPERENWVEQAKEMQKQAPHFSAAE
jgi:predicted flap endonuclease-1-like 5' DNA nuclease/pimeloyl-ACP methyl ester carboxylesterase